MVNLLWNKCTHDLSQWMYVNTHILAVWDHSNYIQYKNIGHKGSKLYYIITALEEMKAQSSITVLQSVWIKAMKQTEYL
jgi:Tfp pilus assembly protein PilX